MRDSYGIYMKAKVHILYLLKCTTTKINILNRLLDLFSLMMQCDNVVEKTEKLDVRMDYCGAHYHLVHLGQRHGGDPHPEHLPRQVHQHYWQP